MSSPTIPTPVRNRIDAVPSLIQYHKSGLGAKSSPPQETRLLPLRTRLAADLLSPINLAQTEAYYEELDGIPSSLLGLESAFSAGHWHVVHPVTLFQVRELSTRVLRDILEWNEITCPNELFIGTHAQVVGFRDTRIKTVEEVREELGRRERSGDAVELEGEWEVIGEKKEGDGKAGEGYEKGEGSGAIDERALEEAGEVGRRAAEEARDRDEYEILMCGGMVIWDLRSARDKRKDQIGYGIYEKDS
ncbi:hypothetical protein FB567DRAFT_457772 [Paraphoma chrysanthemicola]|uniref:Uncharacterized protein n=1 Tax=Paraphoma chrysanthemicola TaxID=798071 RepID=A0A8K0VRI9_9PLEO|nr:hypothetical protein FB567DRAFT_457772 [Paraphoma chrysanthemicola]